MNLLGIAYRAKPSEWRQFLVGAILVTVDRNFTDAYPKGYRKITKGARSVSRPV